MTRTIKGRIYHRPMKTRAIGMTEGGRTKIAVSFPFEMFNQIADSAVKQGIGFQEYVRRLCEIGLQKEKK